MNEQVKSEESSVSESEEVASVAVDVSEGVASQEVAEGAVERVQATSLERLNWWQKMVPGKRRDAQLSDIQTGYSEVLGLVRSMRDNLDAQVVGQKKLVEFMSELPGVADGLRHVGEAAQQQKEVLGVIKTQMETTSVQHASIVTSMDKFNGTLNVMDGTTRKILEGARDTEDSLKEMLERSERRLIWMTSLTIILLLGIGAGIFYLFYDGKLMVGPFAQTSQEEVAVVAPLAVDVEEVGKTAVITVLDFKEVAWNPEEEAVVTNVVAEEGEVVAVVEEEAVAVTNEVEGSLREAEEDVAEVRPKKRRKWFNINLFGQKGAKGASGDVAVEEGLVALTNGVSEVVDEGAED